MTKKNALAHAGIFLPALVVLAGLLVLLGDPLPVQVLRNGMFDQYQRWQPRVYSPQPVRIVDIDEESLARLGQWPWPRTRLAELVDRLNAAGAAAIGFDVVFAEPDRSSPKTAAQFWPLTDDMRRALAGLPDHDAVFAQHIAGAPVVVGFTLEGVSAAASALPARALAGNGAPRAPARPFRYIEAGEAPAQRVPIFASAITSLPQIEAAASGNGALSFVPDSDGVVRRVPLVLRLGAASAAGLRSVSEPASEPVPRSASDAAPTPVSTLVSEMLRVGQGTRNIVLTAAPGAAGELAELRIGALTVPTTPAGEFWLYYTPPVAERYVPAWKVLAGAVPAEALAGQLVLVGASAQGLMDLRFNALGRVIPGVEAHAQALEQILSGETLRRPSWATGLAALLIVVGGLGIGMLAVRVRALIAASAALLALALILGGGWWAFAVGGLLLDTLTPALVLIVSFVVGSLFHHLLSEREQRWMRDAFSRYVSPNRVRHLLEHPEAMALGGRRQSCSFVFTDLAGFTALMEGIDPAVAVSLLNDYLEGLIGIAFRHEGTLDRIVGDAVAIMFSAPVPQADHAARALACALEMDAFASRYAATVQARGIDFGQTRIGVHTGEVIVGNFGGKTMFDYRALGDTVNTAARLESLNRHLGTRLCISAATLAGCPPETAVRPVGRLLLKGKTQALQVFEALGSPPDARYAPLAAYAAAYAHLSDDAPAATSAALAAFRELLAAYPDDPLLRLHGRRLQEGERGDLIVMQEK
ncbi:adenylate/guanylate cyclase domain-containing protein [Rhodocyclus tenuis]|uniref:Adenylate/guanylate cyclase domain-containing protein n=1 Tax=Rhodocyclus gracilis TaxID=2929842 RepID=A0ABX0WNI1_9RHOO|nr:adenylate/guanylate cyclase domain-containing protein [Rhodocyclus gracilis]NJA90120.1 adenylate/guanylate cyclase domain-containing protein [Rhodocyclus gracilis]